MIPHGLYKSDFTGTFGKHETEVAAKRLRGDGDRCGVADLIPYVADDRVKEFVVYCNDLISNDAGFGIDHDFVGFIDDYINYAQILKRKVDVHNFEPFGGRAANSPITVYDVGCATALQHLVFDPRIHYVGIDFGGTPRPKFFRDNCMFVEGGFRDVVHDLKIDPQNAIGIANMSLFYLGSPEDNALFDRTFLRKFVL